MIHRILDSARDVRAWTLAIALAALAGCGSSGEGTGDFTQKFEPPPDAAAASSSVSDHKSRREMKEEDRAQAQARKANH